MLETNRQIENFNKIIDKYINPNKINHAYLIETNCNNRIEIAQELVKKIISFDENNSIEYFLKQQDLYILSTETQSIKKEDIIDLKEKFKTKSIYNSKRIYIIEEAEKLNSSSANTLLKFLEEPESNIIAILITSNINPIFLHRILSTNKLHGAIYFISVFLIEVAKQA
jgi:DNA polymerase-3 subunit delta'